MSDQLPKGVRRRGTSWLVRLADAQYSKRQVSRTFATKEAALSAYYAAVEARNAGGDVEAALDGAALSAPRTLGPARVRTFSEIVHGQYLPERKRLVEVSDPTFRGSPARGVISLRPTTLARYVEELNRVLLPTFGEMRLDQIDRSTVQAWLIELADSGYSPKSAKQYLVRLRAVVGQAGRAEQPDDFPWKGLGPVTPGVPKRPPLKPSVWGGEPGSRPPACHFFEGVALAQLVEPADRAVLYCEHLGGPRIGECFGLHLGDFEYRQGRDGRRRLWVRIHRQVDSTNVERPWVKSDSSYRTIPLADTLARYLEMYVARYHDTKLDDLDPRKRSRRLIVNPAGRDLDGSFLPAVPSNWSSRFVTARNSGGFSHANLGYHLTTHHLRKSVSTYLLNMDLVRRQHFDPGPEPDDPTELIGWLRRQLSAQSLGYSPIHVSAYLGHLHSGVGDDNPAAPVTLTHYHLTFVDDSAFEAIADAIDDVVVREVGTLIDAPSDRDLLPVRYPDDPDWITLSDAATVTGLNKTNTLQAVRKGKLVGELAWLANGGYKRNAVNDKTVPAHPQYMVLRTSAERLGALKRSPSLKQVAQRLGVSAEAFRRNFVETRQVAVVADGPRDVPDPTDVDTVVEAIHDAVLDVVAQGGSMTVAQATAAFNASHGHLFVEGRALERWVHTWLDTLHDQGALRRRLDTGTFTVAANPSRRPR